MSTTISSSVTGPVILAPATDNPLYITSTGTVTSTGISDGIDGGAGTTWTISNAGVVSAAVTGNGVSLAGSGIVGNTGSISGNDALRLSAGGSVTNNVGGSISGLGALGVGIATGAGVYIGGASGTVTNHGAISGVAYGVVLGAGGSVTNASSITGGEDGVTVHGAAATIANYGSITATVDDGIGLFAGGNVTNAAGASISATGTKGAGVYITGGVAAITNAGNISGSSVHGILIEGGGNVLNEATGSISGVNTGVFFKVEPGTVTNEGQITATGTQGSGVYMENGGSVTNTATGTITGHKFGVFLEGAATTLANYGSISGTTYDGVVLGLGGTVTNAAGASISGLTGGIYIKYRAAGTVTNSGNISATGTGSAAIDLADGGVVTNNSTGSISGNAFGVFITGAAGTVTNSGSITSAKYGAVELVKGGMVTNNAGASITGGSNGVYGEVGGSATVTNSGIISAASASGAGVDLAGGGSITNNAGGSISGGGFGIFTTGVAVTVSNSGSISGSHGIALEAGGSVTNTSSGVILGQVAGFFSQGAAATLSNAGSISATAGAAADMEAGGSVSNLAGATLSGSTFGIFLVGGLGTVTNAGAITGGTDGIELGAGGSVTNNAGGSISGTSFGVFTTGVAATVDNSGSISGSKAVGLEAGGSLTNAASGSISGQLDGVHAQVGAATVSNAGHISATAGPAVDLEAGGSVTNLAGATISGSSFGVYINGGSGTVTNAGTISGGTDAVDFAGSGTNRLIVDPGAVFVGHVNGGTGTSTLELAAGTGSISGIGTGSFDNFKGLAVDIGATWTLNGANVAPTVLDNGTLVVAGSFDVSTAIDPSSTGLFQLGSSATLELAAATGSTAQIKFQDSSSELIIDNAALFGTNVGTASYAGPQLQSFNPGDKIDLKNFSSAGVTFNYNASTGLLQVSNSAHQVASIDFQTSSLGSAAFAATSDAANGTIITDGTIIHTNGTTSLVQVGSNYFFDVTGSNVLGPTIKYQGAAVTVGEFGDWTPIGAIQTASGYDVAWKDAAGGQYEIWALDNNGNFVSSPTGIVPGNNLTLESYETLFNQDFNGDGTIGLPSTLIKTDGSTSLYQVGNNFEVEVGGTGPAIKYQGVAVTAGEFGDWTPIGAIQTASGYDVAWKDAAGGQYEIWTLDNNGNFVSSPTGIVTGTNATLESIETLFNQDLNGDGSIGSPPPSLIKTDGSTSLFQAGNNFEVEVGGTGPTIKYQDVAVTVGEFGDWTPIGAIQTASGYDVAWKDAAGGQYEIWALDTNGNFVSSPTGIVTGTNATLESYETLFNQDFNGDGSIGPPPPTLIKTDGSTSLYQVGNNFEVEVGGTGPTIKYAGAAVTVGEFGDWTPIGAIQIANGYDVAWKDAAGGQYEIWALDTNGNFVSSPTGIVPGSDPTLESIETTFNQDLNGDGTIGVPSASQASNSPSPLVMTTSQTSPTSPAAPANAPAETVTLSSGATVADNFVFAPNFGQATITNFNPVSDTIQIDHTMFANVSALLAATHDDVSGNAVITDAQHDSITLKNVTTAQLLAHQTDFHIV